MPRPKDQETLLIASKNQFKILVGLIEKMSDQEKNESFCFHPEEQDKEAHWKRDQNIRDVLIHLYEWHCLLLKWVNSNQQGNSQPFLPHPYNWKTYGQLNLVFLQRHQTTDFDQALKLLKQSHQDTMQMIQLFSSESLFTKGYFDFVGGSTLGQYFVSTTSSHYTWAIQKIKVNQKAKASQHQ